MDFRPALYTYDPAKVTVSILGAVTIAEVTGYAPGTSIRIAPASPSFAKVEGIRGSATRVRHMARGGTIAFSLEERSWANVPLAGMLLADRTAGVGAAIALTVVDQHGLEIAVAPIAWIVGAPEWLKGEQPGVRTWGFECFRLELLNVVGSFLPGA